MTERSQKNTRATRVLVIEPAGLMWGSEYALLDLLRFVDRSRYQIAVVSPIGMPLTRSLNEMGVRVIEGPIGMLHRRGRLSRARALIWLAGVVFRERPQIIHVNQAGVARIAAMARLWQSIPVLVHVRLWEDAKVLADKMARPIGRAWYIAISEFIYRVLNESPSPAESSAGMAGAESPRPPKVTLIYDPFDAATFAIGSNSDKRSDIRNELNIPVSHKVVSIIGRVCREKGQDIFLDAATRVVDTNVTYLVVGGRAPASSDANDFADGLVRQAEASRIVDRVRFLGERTDIARLIAASDAVVLASRNEPFGRVLLESLALKTPVIGPDRGGPAEIIGRNERGFLFVNENASSLAIAIGAVVGDPDNASSTALRGHEWVKVQCSPERHAGTVQDLWDSIVRTTKGDD